MAVQTRPPPTTVTEPVVAPAAVPSAADGTESAEAQVSSSGAQVTDAPVPVVYVFEGVGPLHKGFFTAGDLVADLSTNLGGTLSGNANVYVRYDSAEFVGSIRLRLLPDSLKLPVGGADEVVELQALAPITTALATLRSQVAGRYDVRVDSFAVGIESFRGRHVCRFSVAGTPPPDGRTVSPCVEIDGQERCGEPAASGVRFAPEVAELVRSCLDR